MGIIIYPGGAGGRWLSLLIGALKNNTLIAPSNNGINFHNIASNQTAIQLSHAPFLDERQHLMPNIDRLTYVNWVKRTRTWKIFSTKYSFNIWTNNYKKYSSILPEFNELDLYSKIMFLTYSCYNVRLNDIYRRAYIDNIDIEYTYIFSNPELFSDQLFNVLDEFGIEYNKNTDIVFDGISKFKDTCADISNIVGDINNLAWASWCVALLKKNNIVFECTDKDVNKINEFLTLHNEWCIEKSEPYIFN